MGCDIITRHFSTATRSSARFFHECLPSPGCVPQGKEAQNTMLTADKITKSYGPQTVLKEVTLTLRPKERIGVVGINGAGKSTLVKILAGIEEPDKGTVNYHGSTYGYLSQESQCRLGVTI